MRNKQAARPWADFLATTPYSPEAREGIARIMSDETTDWISLKHGPKTDQEKKAILARITYKRYLMDYVGVNEEATGWFQRNSHGLFARRHPGRQAGDMWALGGGRLRRPRPQRRHLPRHRPHRPAGHDPDGGPTRAWPDGNTSLLRLLVSKLIPTRSATSAAPGRRRRRPRRPGRLQPARPAAATTSAIRLNSTVVDVEPARAARTAIQDASPR